MALLKERWEVRCAAFRDGEVDGRRKRKADALTVHGATLIWPSEVKEGKRVSK